VAQLVRGPGSVSGRELVVGADWLSVGDPASEGETVEFWAHPRRGVRDRGRRITLGWGVSSLRFRTALAPEKWSHVSVSWDETRVRLDLDGQTIESYGLGEPSGVAAPHRLSVGRGALTSAPRWVAIYNSSIDVRSVVRHYRAALPLMRPVADPPASRSGRVVAHAAAVPANTVLPAITGTAKDGQTLTSTTGTWSGSPTSYARQWLRCDTAGANCTNISGATSTTYVLTATDVGKTIRVKVTATNGSGSANVNSAQTATVVAAAPVVSAVPAISGTAKDGQTLTSTTGTWSGTPTITYARQWNRCNSGGTGCVAISGATGTTYVVTTADIGGKLQVTVTASNAAGSASSSSVVTALVVGAVPANTVVPTISGTAKEGQLLSATAGTWTGSAPITYTYQWQSCSPTCANISGATASTYRLVAAQVGKTIKVVVTASNGAGNASATSAATATVTTGVPVNTALPVVTGTTTDGQTLSSTTGTWAGTATITYARQWKRCDGTGANCTNISGATGTTYTLTSPDVGKVIKLTVTATNGVGNTSADAATTAVVAGVAPANTAVPTVTGTAQDTHQLTAGTGTWTGSTPITYSYQWKRCDSAGANCTNIAGAANSTYTLVSADVGATVVVLVTASNSAGSASASTVATTVVTAAAPANTVLPTISGSATDGTELAASPGTWSGTAPITYTYQWQHCTPPGSGCQAIDGETDSSYVVDSDYVGESIRVEVTATNAIGNDSAMSTQTASIASVPRSQTDPMVVDGLTMVGRTLSLNVGGWAGTGPITFQYQWQRCDAGGANCLNISGAYQNSYELTEQDLGSRMRVVGMVFSPSSSAGSYTSPTSAVVIGAAETVASDMTPVAEPLDPTDDDHIEQTAQIINKLGPYYSPSAPCNAVCETAAAEIQALAASLPPDDNVFGPMSKTSGVNGLLLTDDTAQQIVRGAGEAIIGAALVPVEVPMVVAIGVAAAVVGVVVYSGVIGGPRYSEIETIARAGEVPVCGIYPEYATPCPIIGAKSVYYPQGYPLNGDGATMPYDGYAYKYMITTNLGYVDTIATCPNYLGAPQAAPAEFTGRIDAGNTTLCTDFETHAPNKIAVAPGSLYTTPPFTYEPTAPVNPDDVQMGTKPGWSGPGSIDSMKGRVKEALHDEALKRQLAHAENPRCNPSPTADTVPVPAIQEGESGQHYANCLKTLGLDPSVRVRPIADADTSKDPGAVLSGSEDPGTELEPDAPVTVIVNPGPTTGGADGELLRDIEAGLIAHNPELVETIPEFETEVVPVVALQCAKNVKLAEAFAAQEGVDSTASESDCGDEEHAGLPMYISGNTTPQATQNDINALKQNPLWTSLNRRLVSGYYSKREREWYRHPSMTPGCANTVGFTLPGCDEFPYFATLQGQYGILKTQTPHTETVERPQNTMQGSLLSKFYLAGGPGTQPWHGCNVHGHPRTDGAAIPASRFLALPNKNIPTIGICNATP
jgi:hypothetical protein